MRKQTAPANLDSPEMSLILACSGRSLSATQSEHISEISKKPVCWKSVFELSVYHRVLPLVYPKLKPLFDTCKVPDDIQKVFYETYGYQTKLAMMMMGALNHLLKLFAEQNLPVLTLKGPALSYQIYNNPTMRCSLDLDLLMRIEDIGKAQRIVQELGYVMVSPKLELTPKRFEKFQTWSHHISYYHPGLQFGLELHWRPFAFIKQFSLNVQEIFERNLTVEVSGSTPIPVLPLEEMMVYLCCHGGIHAWQHLRWLCDVAEFIGDTKINWKQVVDLTNKKKLSHLVFPGLFLAASIFEKKLPEAILTEIEKRPETKAWVKEIKELIEISVSAEDTPFTNYYLKKKAYLWSLRRTIPEKWNYFLFFAFQPRYWLNSSFPDALYYIERLLSPLIWVRNKFLRRKQ